MRMAMAAMGTLLLLLPLLQLFVPAACADLTPDFYSETCPDALDIIKCGVQKAVQKEPRIAASLLRLHFHDCFVNGCDGSLLLDDTSNFTGEKTAGPNRNSVRGFRVIDDIKGELENACPGVFSCADTLAVAARDSVVELGGPFWTVPLGRRDARTASRDAANNDIPAPTSTVSTLKAKFRRVGLNSKDLVVLSGSHTIGLARCTTFKVRLYNNSGTRQPDPTLESGFLRQLQGDCPEAASIIADNRTLPLDYTTPLLFDNNYYANILQGRGLLNSDQVLLSSADAKTAPLVLRFAALPQSFFKEFAKSMVRMSSISPLTGSDGEIRTNCRRVNSYY